jgi:ABC-type branched-subunit amino acid transport system permease subunit
VAAVLVPIAALIPSVGSREAKIAVAMVAAFGHAIWLTTLTSLAIDAIPPRLLATSFGVIAGGMFVMLGPAVGAIFLLVLSESLRVLIGNQALGVDITIYGLLLILFIIFMPKGILGALLERTGRARPAAAGAPAAASQPVK